MKVSKKISQKISNQTFFIEYEDKNNFIFGKDSTNKENKLSLSKIFGIIMIFRKDVWV